jgi:hypothetical protein
MTEISRNFDLEPTFAPTDGYTPVVRTPRQMLEGLEEGEPILDHEFELIDSCPPAVATRFLPWMMGGRTAPGDRRTQPPGHIANLANAIDERMASEDYS